MDSVFVSQTYIPDFLQRELENVRLNAPDQPHAYIDRRAGSYSPVDCVSVLIQTRYPIQGLLGNLVSSITTTQHTGGNALYILRLAASYIVSAEWEKEAWWVKPKPAEEARSPQPGWLRRCLNRLIHWRHRK